MSLADLWDMPECERTALLVHYAALIDQQTRALARGGDDGSTR